MTLKQWMLVAGLLGVVLSVAGCNTVQGLGADIQEAAYNTRSALYSGDPPPAAEPPAPPPSASR